MGDNEAAPAAAVARKRGEIGPEDVSGNPSSSGLATREA
jgi:hypothetical protein